MCGISGYIGTREVERERVDRTLALMRRRGPDWAGYQLRTHGQTHLALLHTRLSIIDLDRRSNQPFSRGDLDLVFNGEIYNYVEIRRELEKAGHSLMTSSDTEVLIRVLGEAGWPGLDRCEGMWAFALWDAGRAVLTLGRDRFGEKPLYLHRTADGLYFGSEVKFIAALAGIRLPVDASHLCRYLVNGYKSLYKTAHTFFEGVEELPPATVLQVSAGGGETRHRYWTPQYTPDESLTAARAAAEVRGALIEAVGLRLRADVPLAFCMSGGIDSNSLVSIAAREFGYQVHGFTIVNSDARYEEQALVDLAVADLGIRHTAIPLESRDFLPRLRLLVRQHDAPVYTISYYAHWLLMESVAAHGYRISVSGTGADELLTGYYDHHLAYLYELRGDPEGYRRARQAWTQHVQPYVRNPYLQNPEFFVEQPDQRAHIFLNAEAFATYLVGAWSEPFAEEHYSSSLLRNRMLNEMFHEAVPVILHEDDLNAMYFSVENRSPFLDRRLFEVCQRIPTRHLMRDAFTKVLLRDAMRGIVPDQVLDNRRKVGFNAPIHALLDLEDPQVRAQLLDQSPVFEHVRRDRIEALLAKPELPNSESKFLFYFLNTKLFLEEFGS